MIRPAVYKDIEGLVRLENLGFTTDRFSRSQLHYLVSKAQGICLVEESRSRLLGMLILLWRKNSGSGCIYSIVVDPKAQGKGLGRRLMREAERIARQRGLKRLTLQVRIDNMVAIRLYEGLGYKRAGLIRDYYSDGGAAIHFRKPLRGFPIPSSSPRGGSPEGKGPTLG